MNNIVNYCAKTKTNQYREVAPNTSVVQPHGYLFRMGEKLDGIYMLNSGSVKLFRTTETGEEYISGFCMPGELIGLDALADGVSRTSAVALDTSSISLIPFKTLVGGGDKFDYSTFIHKIGATLNRESDHIMMLSQRTADRRLAWFLVEFANGLASRGLSPTEFSLPMTRTDVATFLGLAVETVCRELSNLCDAGIVKKNRRRIQILDMTELNRISIGHDSDDLQMKRNRSAA